MKAHLYWSYATRSLTRGGQRSLLAIFCVAVGVMAIVALQLVSNAINTGLTSNVRAINGGDLSVTSPTTPLTVRQLTAFDQLRAQGALTAYTAADAVGGVVHTATASRQFQVEAVDPAHFPLDGAPVFTHPRSASLTALLQGNTVVLTTPLAQTLGVAVGDTTHVYLQDGRSADVAIGGIVESAGLFRGSLLLINADFYATLPGAGGQSLTYNAIYADVPGHTDANAASAKKLIQQRLPLVSVQTTAQALSQNSAQVQQVQYFLQIVGLLALLIGGVGIVNTMQMLLRRRRVEIAMLKTAGYQRHDLFALFGLEAGLIGLVGGMVGTAAGVGVSFVVKQLTENSLQIVLPTVVDAGTLGAGVAVGFLTALIFGLLPIVRGSQVRPQAVLRDMPERAGWASRVLTAALVGLLVVLFFALSLSILRNVTVTALAVGGTGIFLLLLSLFLGGVVFVLSKLPVAPMPRTWKANVKLALRNIGRQKVRTVATMAALYIGVFAVGLIVVFGQNISDSLNSFLASGNGINAEIVAPGTDAAATQQQLARVSGLQHEVMVPFSPVVPVAVNGQDIGQLARTATAGGTYTVANVTSALAGVQGYDLAHGAAPDSTDAPLAKGSHDTVRGRTLSAGDAGTGNALLPVSASQAPDNLKLGDTITVASSAGGVPVTLTIVGFYSSALPQFGPILTDSGVVTAVASGSPRYGFRMHLDPKTADATLARIQTAVPGVVAFSLADFVDQYAALLNNLVTVLVAVASLAMLASVIIIANAVGLAMLERRRELGILKAVGHTSRSVLGEVLVENGLVGFTGAALAMLVVALVAALLGKMAFNLPIAIPANTALLIVLGTVAICMLVAAAVAWGATRVRPAEVLRYE